MTVWDWLKQVTYVREPWDNFSEEDKESFNVYMLHKVISMHEPYIELANYLQNQPVQSTNLVKRSQIVKSLAIPAQYYIDRSYSAEVLNKYDVGLCTKEGKEYRGWVCPTPKSGHPAKWMRIGSDEHWVFLCLISLCERWEQYFLCLFGHLYECIVVSHI